MCRNYSKTALCHRFLLGQRSTPDKHLGYVLMGICELLSWLIFAFARKVESEDLAGFICISVYTKCRFNYGNKTCFKATAAKVNAVLFLLRP